MDVVMLSNILEQMKNYRYWYTIALNNFRNRNDEMFSQRSRKGCSSTLIQRCLIDNGTRFKEYFRASFELFYNILHVQSQSDRHKKAYQAVSTASIKSFFLTG